MKILILTGGSLRGLSIVAALAIGVTALAFVARPGPASPVDTAATSLSAVTIQTKALPEQEAGLRLANLTGGECQAWLSAWVLPPAGDVDARILGAGGSGNWLERGVWIGDAESAAEAFGATWAARSATTPEEIWVETKLDGPVTQIKLVGSVTPGGHQIWSATDSARVAPCSSHSE